MLQKAGLAGHDLSGVFTPHKLYLPSREPLLRHTHRWSVHCPTVVTVVINSSSRVFLIAHYYPFPSRFRVPRRFRLSRTGELNEAVLKI